MSHESSPNRDLPLGPEKPDLKQTKILDRLSDVIKVGASSCVTVPEVLIISGDDHYSEIIRNILIYKGFNVVDARLFDKKILTQALSSAVVGIVDSDTMLEMDRAQIMKLTTATPLLALSSVTTPQHALKLKGEGFITVLNKPFVPSYFLNLIREITLNSSAKQATKQLNQQTFY